jgi:hypothetical protein
MEAMNAAIKEATRELAMPYLINGDLLSGCCIS